MRAGKIVLLVVGIIVILISLAPLLVGGGLMIAERTLRDNEGFYTAPRFNLTRDSYAIVTEPANIDVDGDWDWIAWLRQRQSTDFLTIKVEGSSTNTSKHVFLGIAEANDLRTYLQDVTYDEITDLDMRPADLGYTTHAGTRQPELPTEQIFWASYAHGSGTQELRWNIEQGTYSLVLMNADASQGVNLQVAIGVKAPPVLGGISLGLLIGGLVLLGVGILLIVLAVRSPRTSTL